MSDAEATEGSEASLDFVMTLTRAYSRMARVDYATSDGTATAGSDYTAVSSRVVVRVGETSKTISVAIGNDDVTEADGETVNLTLSNRGGGEIIDGDAVGTIQDGTGTDESSDEFTAEFRQVPASHDGSTKFTFRLRFSEKIKQGTKRNLFRALERTGANMKQVLRVDDRLDLFEFTFEPKGNDDVTVTLGPSTTDCTARDAICTAEGTALTGTINATISGP